MRYGILTYHKSHNFGAYMQALSLVKAMENAGFDVEIVNYNSFASEKLYKRQVFQFRRDKHILYNYKRAKMFDTALTNLPLGEGECLVTDDMDAFRAYIKGKYDVLITGSDEIWAIGGIRPFPNAYWLPDVEGVKKISYAASSRNVFSALRPEEQKAVSRYLASYDYIGVRDRATKKLVSEALPETADTHMNCDPTFAYEYGYTYEYGRELLRKKFRVDTDKPIIGLMLLDKELASTIIRKYNGKVQLVALYTKYDGIPSNPNITPLEWVAMIAGLDGLITTYFHGMCFALKSNVDFLVIEKSVKVEPYYSKTWDLLERHSMTGHYVANDKTEEMYQRIYGFIDGSCRSAKTKQDFSGICATEKAKFSNFLNEIRSICSEENQNVGD